MTKTIIGVISDTHGLLRPEAKQALEGCDAILHAGDIGSAAVLDELRELAPLHVVRGNVDCAAWAMAYPETEAVKIGSTYFYIVHNIGALDIDPAEAGFDVVIFGHSHRQHNDIKNGVLYFNPASAGPRRFALPVSVGRFYVDGGTIRAEFINLMG